ncbi:MAG: hypothetical protein FWD57_12795 [Polyangiaceae bacterium]|nr:hypothetical protein [Polyangiaceae bacterium]
MDASITGFQSKEAAFSGMKQPTRTGSSPPEKTDIPADSAKMPPDYPCFARCMWNFTVGTTNRCNPARGEVPQLPLDSHSRPETGSFLDVFVRELGGNFRDGFEGVADEEAAE